MLFIKYVLGFPSLLLQPGALSLILSFEAHCKHQLFHPVGPDATTDKISAFFDIGSSLCCLLGINLVLFI